MTAREELAQSIATNLDRTFSKREFGPASQDYELADALLADGWRKVDGGTSDGYHTFNELYEFRKLYNAALFNAWRERGGYDVHKSWKHSDGELCFGGDWFIVMAQLPTGQISNHYEASDWDLFQIPERDTANQWDGHTAADVAERLASAIRDES